MNDSKKTVKFNFIDVVIVAAVLIIAAFVVYIFAGNEILDGLLGSGNDFAYVRYTVSLSSIEDRYVGYVKEGAAVRRGEVVIGHIEKVKVAEVERTELNERTEQLVNVNYPDHKKVDMDIIAKASLKDGFLYVDKDVKVAVGSYVEFVTSGFKSYGYITNFEELDYEPEFYKPVQAASAVNEAEALANG